MKVIVGGCSVSDYTGPTVNRVYGEILASNIGVDYVRRTWTLMDYPKTLLIN